MAEYIQVITTTDNREQAEQIARKLVEERLAACVQVTGQIRSVYRWQDEVEQADEWLCMAKTRRSLFSEVEATIRKHHSYDCPEVIAVPIVESSADYLDWLAAQLMEERA